MRNFLGTFILGMTAVFLGCQTVSEPIPVKPVPVTGPATLSDLLDRVRLQAANANAASYTDDWSRLEDLADEIMKTAGRLPQAEGIAADRLAKLETGATALGKDAAALREAAREKKADTATEALTRINRGVRELDK